MKKQITNSTGKDEKIFSDKKKYTLFLGCIPGHITSEEIKNKYSRMGEIFNIKLNVGKRKNKSKGVASGFGTFCTTDRKFYSYLISTPQKINGRDIICRPYYTGKEKDHHIASYQNRRIYVKGLEKAWTDEDIFLIFSQKWAIERAYAIRDHNGRSQCYGYVNFVEYEDAKKMVDQRFLIAGNSKIECFPYYKSKDYKQKNSHNLKKRNFEVRISNRFHDQNSIRRSNNKEKKRRPNLDFKTKEPLKCVRINKKRMIDKIKKNHGKDNLVLIKVVLDLPIKEKKFFSDFQ